MNSKNKNFLVFEKILSKRNRVVVKTDSQKIATLFYFPKDCAINEVVSYLQEGYNILFQFFHFQPPPFRLALLSSRQEMDKFTGEKTPPWLVGQAKLTNTICLFSPSIIEKVSPHKKQEFKTLLWHEMTHLFIRQIHKSFEPIWLEEGLAYFLAGQKIKQQFDYQSLFKPTLPFLLDTEKKWQEAIPYGAYTASFLLVDFLIKYFGEKKFIKLLVSLKGRYSQKMFRQKFIRIYRQEVKEITEKFLQNLNMKTGGEKGVSRSSIRNSKNEVRTKIRIAI